MKPIVLLHGALGHTDHFAPLLPWLQQHFNLHTFLFQGHGATPIPPAGIRMQAYVDQLQAYLQARQLNDVAVFGYSMGGYVALAHMLQHPGIIGSLLTLATKLHWTTEGAQQESRMLNPDAIQAKVPAYAAQLAALHGDTQWRQLLPAIAGMMEDLGKKPLIREEHYARIKGKVQLMVGDKDAMVSLAETAQAAKAIPGARLAVLPGTKHPLDQVRPVLLPGLMKDFWEL